MVDYTQFGTEPEDFRLSFNVTPPFDVQDDQTTEEATREWIENMSDEELGQFIRNNAVVEPW